MRPTTPHPSHRTRAATPSTSSHAPMPAVVHIGPAAFDRHQRAHNIARPTRAWHDLGVENIAYRTAANRSCCEKMILECTAYDSSTTAAAVSSQAGLHSAQYQHSSMSRVGSSHAESTPTPPRTLWLTKSRMLARSDAPRKSASPHCTPAAHSPDIRRNPRIARCRELGPAQ